MSAAAQTLATTGAAHLTFTQTNNKNYYAKIKQRNDSKAESVTSNLARTRGQRPSGIPVRSGAHRLVGLVQWEAGFRAVAASGQVS